MEVKKSKAADLEKKRMGFRFLGLVAASAVVLMAFTFSSVEIIPIKKEIVKEESVKEEILEEFFQNEPPPPPPPTQAPPPVVVEVKEVEDDIIIEPVDQIDEDLRDFDFEPDKIEKVEKKIIYDVVGVSPEFPGGEAEMAKFLQETFEYPPISVEMGEQGIVYVEFVVNKDGSIEAAKVVKGVSSAIDKEALRVVKKMPKWKPGEQAGKAVNVRYTIPIRAKLS